jgi:hypothetical protein
MDLFPHERHRLDDIDGYLGGQEPRLVSMFDIFTRLTREDGKPPAERQFLAAGHMAGQGLCLPPRSAPPPVSPDGLRGGAHRGADRGDFLLTPARPRLGEQPSEPLRQNRCCEIAPVEYG